ncbi:MAG: aconitase X swivel domain-containing protein [Hyphomicrobiaceae bacterium]
MNPAAPTQRTFLGHPGPGSTVTGEALVAADNFSARYDLDLTKGIFSRPAHKLVGQSYVGKILVLNIAKGGVATAWMLRAMVESGWAPKALILNFANPIMAQGAAFADLALVDRFDVDITGALRSGEMVRVEPSQGLLSVVD